MTSDFHQKRKWFRREVPFHLMILPGVILVLLFKYLPIVGLGIAFQQYTPLYDLFHQKWIGWNNFIYVFSLPSFTRVIYNTIFIAILKIIGNLMVPVFFALLLNELRNLHYKRVLQTVVYMPYFVSWVALAAIFLDILSPSSGFVNDILRLFGAEPVFFLGEPKIFPYTMAVTDVWRNFGWNTIVYLAAITNVDPTLYEAAFMDGAGRIRQTLSVTIPCILPIILLMTVLSIGNVLRAGFDQVYNMYSPRVYSTGDIIDTFVYRLGILDVQFGPATAVGLFQSFVSFILISIGYFLADKVAGYRVF
jgi:putative aldouronate transport system permease protein